MDSNKKYHYMTRQELAYKAGVHPRTLYTYLLSIWPELDARGCSPRKRLTPAAVEYICEHYGIDL